MQTRHQRGRETSARDSEAGALVGGVGRVTVGDLEGAFGEDHPGAHHSALGAGAVLDEGGGKYAQPVANSSMELEAAGLGRPTRPPNARATSMDWGPEDEDLGAGLPAFATESDLLVGFAELSTSGDPRSNSQGGPGGVGAFWDDDDDDGDDDGAADFLADGPDDLMGLGPLVLNDDDVDDSRRVPRRPYADISATSEAEALPSSRDPGRSGCCAGLDDGSGQSDERHVDTKPRLASSSSDDRRRGRGVYGGDDSSSDDVSSRSPPSEREGKYTGASGLLPAAAEGRRADGLSGGAGGLGSEREGCDGGGEAMDEENASGRSSSRGAAQRQAGQAVPPRDHSPLSQALKFLYAAASPKMALHSSSDGQSGGSGSGSDSSQRGDSSFSGGDRASRGRQPLLMSDTAILRDMRRGGADGGGVHRRRGAVDAGRVSAAHTQQHHQPPVQSRPLGVHGLPSARPQAPLWAPGQQSGTNQSGQTNQRDSQQHPVLPPPAAAAGDHRTVHATRYRSRQGARRPYDHNDEGECYSDVEAEYRHRTARNYRAETLEPQPAAPPAEAKRPALDGTDLKKSDEAKEIAENALLDALHKQEAKLEAKQEAPEYMDYTMAGRAGAEAEADTLAPDDRRARLAAEARVHHECLPEPDETFFSPFVVVYRHVPDNKKQSGMAGLGHEPRRGIVRCGASFALEELTPPPTSSPLDATRRLEAERRRREKVECEMRVQTADALRRSAPRGVVVLGGRRDRKPSFLPIDEAAQLLSHHDDPEGESSAEEQEAAKHDLEELLAQKSARKPPRRSARPLAPAGVELSPDERIALERERNREHARNTRLRKKAALANLKDTVQKLTAKCQQSDRAALERRARGAVKRTCIEAFFRYRARAERDRARWAQVVTEDVELWQPVSPHRSFKPAEVHGTRRLSKGVDALVEDAASLAVLFRSIGRRGSAAAKFDRAPRFVFEATIASRDQSESAITDAFTASDVVGMHWCMRTLDALEFGVDREVAKNGMLVAKFDRQSCKVKYIEFVYDVKAFAYQIQRALKLAAPPTVPNTLKTSDVLDDHDDARVVTTATRPHVISDCNSAWMDMCGVSRKEDVLGHTLSVIQGELTDEHRLAELLDNIARGRCADALLINYRLNGDAFLNYLRAFPLYADAKEGDDPAEQRPTHYLGILKDVIADTIPPGGPGGASSGGAPGVQQQQQQQQQQQLPQAGPALPVVGAGMGVMHPGGAGGGGVPGVPGIGGMLHAQQPGHHGQGAHHHVLAQHPQQQQQPPMGGPAGHMYSPHHAHGHHVAAAHGVHLAQLQHPGGVGVGGGVSSSAVRDRARWADVSAAVASTPVGQAAEHNRRQREAARRHQIRQQRPQPPPRLPLHYPPIEDTLPPPPPRMAGDPDTEMTPYHMVQHPHPQHLAGVPHHMRPMAPSPWYHNPPVPHRGLGPTPPGAIPPRLADGNLGPPPGRL